VTTVGRICG